MQSKTVPSVYMLPLSRKRVFFISKSVTSSVSISELITVVIVTFHTLLSWKRSVKSFQYSQNITLSILSKICKSNLISKSIIGRLFMRRSKHSCKLMALMKMCADLEKANPDSVIILERGEDDKFKRVFLCFSASSMGFSYCSPLLSLNGTHLKAKYKGILLAATTMDTNGSLFLWHMLS